VVIGLKPGARQLAFQRASTWLLSSWPDPRGPQQLHLDIRVDVDAAERAVLAIGARRLEPSARPASVFSQTRSVTHSAWYSARKKPSSQCADLPLNVRVFGQACGGRRQGGVNRCAQRVGEPL